MRHSRRTCTAGRPGRVPPRRLANQGEHHALMEVRAAGRRGAGAPPTEARLSILDVRAAGRRGAGAPPTEARLSILDVRAAGRRGAGAPPTEARLSILDPTGPGAERF